MPNELFSKFKKIFPSYHLRFTPIKSGLNTNVAFTLIEVMVTTAIILLLSGLSYSVITSAQRSNRDTLRRTDLNNLQSTLQQYYTDQSYYPSLTTTGLSAASSLTNCTGAPAGCTVSKTYLNKLPGDPSTGANYYYLKLPAGCDNSTVALRCYNYCVYTTLENTPASPISPSSSCSIPVTGQSFNYVVTQP